MATKLHTLGPETTDSYRAAEYLKQIRPKFKDVPIELHHSYESIYDHLAQYKGDYFLVPVAYQSHDHDNNWADNNYHFWQELTVVDTFALPTFPMVLVENDEQGNKEVVLHAATIELIRQFERKTTGPLKHSFVTSKPLAQTAFATGDYQYAIFSKPKQPLQVPFQHHTINQFDIQMIWCLYQIKA